METKQKKKKNCVSEDRTNTADDPTLQGCTSETGNFPRPSASLRPVLEGNPQRRCESPDLREPFLVHTPRCKPRPSPPPPRAAARPLTVVTSSPSRPAVQTPPRTRLSAGEDPARPTRWHEQSARPASETGRGPGPPRALTCPEDRAAPAARSGSTQPNLRARPARHHRPRLPPRRRTRRRRPHDNAAQLERPPAHRLSTKSAQDPAPASFPGSPRRLLLPFVPRTNAHWLLTTLLSVLNTQRINK